MYPRGSPPISASEIRGGDRAYKDRMHRVPWGLSRRKDRPSAGRRTPGVFGGSIVALAVLAAAFVLAPPADANPRKKKAPAVDVSGLWASTYEDVRLRQHGAYIEGEYVCCGGGTIDGKLVGKEIRYHWAGADGTSGNGVWTVVDRKTIRGTWGSDESTDDGGEWNLDKLEDDTAIAN
jgi:hypothetical protein